MAITPAFLDNCAGKAFGFYADDHCGGKIARAGLTYDEMQTQVANMEVCGYEVVELDAEQQIALLLHETGTK